MNKQLGTDSGNYSNNLNEKDKYIYELVFSRFNLEWTRLNDLDSKAGNIIGFASLIIALEINFISENFNKIQADETYIMNFYLIIASVVFLIWSLCLGFASSSIKKWKVVPETNHLITSYAAQEDKSYIETLVQVTKELNFAIEENKKKSEDKALYVNYSQICLELAVFLFILLFIFVFLI